MTFKFECITDRVVLKSGASRRLAIPPFSPAPEDRREHPSIEMLQFQDGKRPSA
jgi:hypothetical protein